ncbi:hypothetical protein SY83_14350 [Paenibacillus swuensis]|uniref:Phospholipid/glycerol acyltransferase domain-containing protein n=1 Tax=Paenibacillus swuensis TaxID=1178515 RepID=A0A172TKF7_9BACL|nr:lysophospholipid acyltransferase family protein [Paenibacillus swuensis]ANE47253.1 hypothetical protein SY83_14350 [Paenibacillus swuensis]
MVIQAQKSKRFNAIFRRYNEWYLLRRHFHSFHVRGQADPLRSGPVLYVMNHSSWWDGLLAYHAEQTLSERDHYIMMDEKQLQKFRFFCKIGAFSIDKSSAAGTVQSLKYALKLLQQGRSVWIFPQGDIKHQELRPLELHSGAGYMLERCPDTTVIPVTLYYTLGLHQKAEASMMFGEALNHSWAELGRKAAMSFIQEKLEEQLDRHKSWIVQDHLQELALFRPYLGTGKSTSDRFEHFGKWVSRWNPFSGS